MSKFTAKPVRSYIMKPERVREISLRFQPPNIITTHLHSFKTITRFPFYSPSFSHLSRLIILFFFKKHVGINILKIELKIISGKKKETPMIRICLLKKRRREVKVDPHLVANGRRRRRFSCSEVNGRRRRRRRFPCLEVNGRRRRRFPCLEVNGRKRRRFPCLEANGMFQAWWPMEGEGKIPFHLFPLSPQPIYLNLQFFPSTLRFYFSMVISYYTRISFFSLIYKL
jgi:hypothetical protein